MMQGGLSPCRGACRTRPARRRSPRSLAYLERRNNHNAHAIAEAVQRPTTRCVPVKTGDQLDLQALHRVRSGLISGRTAVINQIRGFLLEHGIPVRQGLRFLRQQLPEILAKRIDVLSPRMSRIIEDLSGDWRQLDERIEQLTQESELLARGTERCRQLMTIPGIGPIIASAMIAAIVDGTAFAKGRTSAPPARIRPSSFLAYPLAPKSILWLCR